MSKGFVYRFLIYGVVVAYVLLDLKVVKGPLHNWVLAKRGMNHAELIAEGVVATVYGQPIVKDQVDYQMSQYLYLRGRTRDQLSNKEQELIFNHCLEQLILQHLLRTKVHHNEVDMPKVSEIALEKETDHDQKQFSSIYERESVLDEFGYFDGELKLRSEAHLQQRQYLNRQITVDITDAESASFKERSVTVPQRIKVRHIFLSSLNRNTAEVKKNLEFELQALKAGTITFEALSSKINEDTRAKMNSGLLGWITPNRLPTGLDSTVLFDLDTNEPTMLKSSIGWHYIEVLEKKPSEIVERSDKEIRAYLENQKREKGLDLYLKHLRYREGDNVVILKH